MQAAAGPACLRVWWPTISTLTGLPGGSVAIASATSAPGLSGSIGVTAAL